MSFPPSSTTRRQMMLSLPMNQHTSPLCFFLSFDFKRNRKLSGFSLISNQTNCFYSFYSYARQLHMPYTVNLSTRTILWPRTQKHMLLMQTVLRRASNVLHVYFISLFYLWQRDDIKGQWSLCHKYTVGGLRRPRSDSPCLKSVL